MNQTNIDFNTTPHKKSQPCYLFFDTETTGLPKNYNAPLEDLDNWPRLVQIAWAVYDTLGQLLDEVSLIVKPEGFEIPTQASNIHGISTEQALAKGLPLIEVLAKFNVIVKESKFLIAHNMSYDIKIIEAEFLRCKLEHNLHDLETICTKELATDFCAIAGNYGSYKWPRLSELHSKLFGVNFEDAHDALVDVRATAKCFWELKSRGLVNIDS